MGIKKPFEISLEVNDSCNYSCEFCFGKNSVDKRIDLSREQAKKVIEKIAAEGIERIRFTGGEPLLWPHLQEIISFAKQQGLFTSLNTNGSLFSKESAKELAPVLDDVLVSFHALNDKSEQQLCGQKGLFDKKISAIKDLANQGVFVRASTILSGQNISALEEFNKTLENLPVSQWVLLRPIPNSNDLNPISCTKIAEAVEKLVAINKNRKNDEFHLIENALPFCCANPENVSKVALGGIREDGHSSLFINSSLEIKPSYFLNRELGSALETPIKEAWESPFMQKMHALEFIAEQCHDCKYVMQCMAGSRFSALRVNKSLYALDPLASSEKFIRQ